MARVLDSVSIKGAIRRLEGLSSASSRALEVVVGMLNTEGRVLASELSEKFCPYEDRTMNLNRNLNRLMTAVNRVAKEQGVTFSMRITLSKRGGASSRWV